MNNAEENYQHENADEEESLYIPNWFVEVMESITREEMINRGICTTNRLFQQLCYPKLHGKVEPHRIGYLQISYNYDRRGPLKIPYAVIKKRNRQTKLQETVQIPHVAPPPYITGFDCIDIRFLNEHVMEFLGIIAPFFKKCAINCEMLIEDWKANEKRTQQLRQLLMTLMVDGKISMLSFAGKSIHCFQQLFPEIIEQVQCLSIEESNLDFDLLLNWLMKNRNDRGQKILRLSGNGMEVAILNRIKKEFSMSTSSANFLISWQQNFEYNKFKMENVKTEEILELYANSKGQCFLARFPKGEDHWKEVGEKKMWPDNDEETTMINLIIEQNSDGSPRIDSNWEELRKAIQKILEKKNTGRPFEELYRNAYTMALHRQGQMLYCGISAIIREHFQMMIREMLTELIIDNNDSEQFIEYLNNEWKEFKIGMIMIRDICMYLQRIFISHNGLLPFDQLGLHIFKKEIVNYPPINKHLKEIFGINLKEKIDDSLFDFLSKHI